MAYILSRCAVVVVVKLLIDRSSVNDIFHIFTCKSSVELANYLSTYG